MAIYIDGLDDLMERLEDLPDKITEGMRKGVSRGLLTLQAAQAGLAPVDTGELRTSIKTEVVSQGDTIKGRTFTNAPHAAPNEFGTGQPGKSGETRGGGELSPDAASKSHTNKKGWTYYSNRLGRFVYTRGMAAHPFMYPGLKLAQKQIKQDIADSIKSETKG